MADDTVRPRKARTIADIFDDALTEARAVDCTLYDFAAALQLAIDDLESERDLVLEEARKRDEQEHDQRG